VPAERATGAPTNRPAPPRVSFRRASGPRVTQLPDPRLLGRWRLFRADASLDFAPNVRMEFLSGGRLRYTFDAGETSQSLMLVYRVEGDMLFTDNPAASHAISSRFWFAEGDSLAIDFAGAVAWFIREL
jgi:hypothetical protein